MNKKYLAVFLGLSLSTGVFANEIYFSNIVDGYSSSDPTSMTPSLTIDCHIPNSFPIGLNPPEQIRETPSYAFMGSPSGTYQCSVEVEGTQYDNGVIPKIVQLGSFKMQLNLANNAAYFYAFQLRPLRSQDNLGVRDLSTNKMEHVVGMVAGSQNSLVFAAQAVKQK